MSLTSRFIEKRQLEGERCKTIKLERSIQFQLKRKLIVMDKQECVFLKVDDIQHAEASGSYTQLYLTNGNKMLVSKNIKAIMEKLPEEEFLRVHKSYLININSIAKYVKSDGGYLVLDNGDNIPVSVRKRHEITKAIESWSI